MPGTKQIVSLEGKTTIAYRQVDGEWYATALEFDIMGYGDTKAKARMLLNELLEVYLHDVAQLLAEGKRVKFFNPSDDDEWNAAEDIETCRIQFTLDTQAAELQPQVRWQGLGKLVEFIDSLDGLHMDLIAA